MQGQLGDRAEELQSCLRAVALEPGVTERLIAAAEILASSGGSDVTEQYENAIRILGVAVAREPDSAALWALISQYEAFVGADGADAETRGRVGFALAGMAFTLSPQRPVPGAATIDVAELLASMWAPIPGEQAAAQDFARITAGVYGDDLALDQLGPSDVDALSAHARALHEWISGWRLLRDGWPLPPEDAAKLLDELRRICLELSPQLADVRLAGWQLAKCYLDLAEDPPPQRAAGECRELARDLMKQSCEYWRSVIGYDRFHLCVGYETLELDYAETCILVEGLGEAEEAFKEVVRVSRDPGLVQVTGASPEAPISLLAETGEVSRLSRALGGLAEVEFRDERSESAMSHCYEALRQSPRYTWPRFLLHQLYAQRGEFDRATDQLNCIADIIPDWGSDLALAQASLLQQQSYEARSKDEETEKLVRLEDELRTAMLSPLPPEVELAARMDLTSALSRRGLNDAASAEALTAVRRVRTLKPDAMTHSALADLLEDVGALGEAEAEHRAAWALVDRGNSVQTALVANSLAWFLTEQRIHLDEAEAVSSAAVAAAREAEDTATLANCLDTAGWASYRHGKHQAALTAITESLGAEENAERWIHLAQILLALSATTTKQADAADHKQRAAEVLRHLVARYPSTKEADAATKLLATWETSTLVPQSLLAEKRPRTPRGSNA
jgi:tetratricopeptide (TPR) repeat protein